MKRILKILGVLVALILIAATVIHFRGIPTYEVTAIDHEVASTPEQIEAGKKFVVTLCAGCHMNRETGKLTGKQMLDIPSEFGTIYSPNITQDDDYGIGTWTNGDLLRLLRTGVKKDGKYAPPYMAKLPKMADQDLDAIIAFLKSDDPLMQAVATADKASEPSFLVKLLSNVAFKPLPMPTEEIPMPDTADVVGYGKYLAHNFDCYSCHSADFKSIDVLNPSKSKGYFGGGNPTLNEEGQVILTRNLTPDKETGIGNWTKEAFTSAVKSGAVDGQQGLRYPMIPYSLLTDYEVSCIYDYLQTIPAISNKLERQFYD
jgi:cytochrome c2